MSKISVVFFIFFSVRIFSRVDLSFVPSQNDYSPLPRGPLKLDREMANAWIQAMNDCFESPAIRCDPNNIFYSADGSCNNLIHPHWGKVSTPFCRLTKANYADGFYKMTPTKMLPREIRASLLPDREDILSCQTNTMFLGFGQLVAHDSGLNVGTPNNILNCCPGYGTGTVPVNEYEYDTKCCPILIPKNDYFYSKLKRPIECLNLTRINNTLIAGCDIVPIFQINSQTSFFDLSILYGKDKEEAKRLRAGNGGLMKIANPSETNNQEYPPILHGPDKCPLGGLSLTPGQQKCFDAGDVRVSQNPEVMGAHSLLLRFHNLVAKSFHKAFPDWDDEKIYQWARKFTITVYQNVLCDEFLRVYIGPEMLKIFDLTPVKVGYETGYNPRMIPQVISEFQGSAGRAAHSMNLGTIVYDRNRNKSYSLRNVLFNMGFLLEEGTFSRLMHTFTWQPSQVLDQYITKDFVDLLKMPQTAPLPGDLIALDIIRGHDFGIQSFNNIREKCGLPRFNNFNELYGYVWHAEIVIPILEYVYGSIDELELYVGGMLELPLPGAVVGPTLGCIIGQTYHQLKFSDRLWHSFPTSGLTLSQLDYIREIKFSDIICLTNPELTEVPHNAFLIPSERMKQCCEVKPLDFTDWFSMRRTNADFPFFQP